MNKNSVSCGFESDLAAFSSNALPADRRREFLAHLIDCQPCVNLLESIAEDEKLAQRDLDTTERAQVDSIVQSARKEIAAGLESERPRRHRDYARQGMPFPSLAGRAQGALWRPMFVVFSTAAASALCLWLFSRLA